MKTRGLDRLSLTYELFALALIVVFLRLFYFQAIKGSELKAEAAMQHVRKSSVEPTRGAIMTADGYPLVITAPTYNLVEYKPHLTDSPQEIVEQIIPLLNYEVKDPQIVTDSAKVTETIATYKEQSRVDMLEKLNTKNWAILARNLSIAERQSISELGIKGLTFEEGFSRSYPESSMSAHLLGFVGKNDNDQPIGYFGLEGYYNRELEGKVGREKLEQDASGNPLLIGMFRKLEQRDGRDLTLFIERGVQHAVEQELKDAIERYGASSGEVIVMDPKTGAILAMASFPHYQPDRFIYYDTSLYKNPSIANTYEPGSTFKVLVAAAALNEKAINPEDECDICSAPLPIDKYFIKTWNNEYRANAKPEDIIVNSDNVGMVWMQRALGEAKMLEYLKAFGFDKKTGIDLQEEVAPPWRSRWSEIDYATASFGQGIAVTSIQMVTAVAAIANGGYLMEPHVVKSFSDSKDVTLVKPKVVRQVINSESARIVTEMMVKAVEKGEAQWTKLNGYQIAGKTGTAQVAIGGNYDKEKTITSFVGFAPAHDPKFVVLTKLREPTTSPWGSETAAPLFFKIAKRLFLHYNIAPDN